ncbi:hypothetical protein AVEN_4787-1 [Araneus ventricosus]|uniref:Uncharacterized protein n=1 Tax=Araneus ventricosus TaxID=182803 RepID=A0A4Y2VEY1_ARAVE|nr:hypothetical protein AVEN_4787-1 [Araneus ventricosus]
MDTDSFYISVETDDVFLDMKTSLNNIFDLSNYPKNHFLSDDSNRGRLGYFNTLPTGSGSNILCPFTARSAADRPRHRRDKSKSRLIDDRSKTNKEPGSPRGGPARAVLHEGRGFDIHHHATELR